MVEPVVIDPPPSSEEEFFNDLKKDGRLMLRDLPKFLEPLVAYVLKIGEPVKNCRENISVKAVGLI